jgi:hypothetical protein
MNHNPIEKSLVKLIGHTPPFTDDEYASINGPLIIEHTADISLVSKCTNLTHLEIYASELHDLSVLKKLPRLKVLKIMCTDVRDIEILKECETIEVLDLSFTFIQDITPVLELKHLKELSLLGTPLSEESWNRIIPELLKIKNEINTFKIKISGKSKWKLTRKMYDNKMSGCFSNTHEYDQVLVKPGKPQFTDLNCDAIIVDQTSVKYRISEGMSLEEIFVDLQNFEDEFHLVDLSYFREPPKPKGVNFEEALSHVAESNLPESAKKNIISFLYKFPYVYYDWFKEENFNLIKKNAEVILPEWLHDQLAAFSTIFPGTVTRFKFNEFKYDSVYFDSLPDFWFYLNFGFSVCSTYDYIYYKGQKMAIVGSEVESLTSILLVNIADPDDKSVYEFTYENISVDGEITDKDLKKVFDSYDEIYTYIVKFATPDKEFDPVNPELNS